MKSVHSSHVAFASVQITWPPNPTLHQFKSSVPSGQPPINQYAIWAELAAPSTPSKSILLFNKQDSLRLVGVSLQSGGSHG